MLLYIHNCFVLSWHAGLLPADSGDAYCDALLSCLFVMPYCDAILCVHGSCSKSFGESTPHREACKAHRSPNDLELGPSGRLSNAFRGAKLEIGDWSGVGSWPRHFGSCQKALRQ